MELSSLSVVHPQAYFLLYSSYPPQTPAPLVELRWAMRFLSLLGFIMIYLEEVGALLPSWWVNRGGGRGPTAIMVGQKAQFIATSDDRPSPVQGMMV